MAPSTALTAAAMGRVNFNIIDINVVEVATCFQTFLDRGTKITGVSLDDIDVGVNALPANTANATVSDLLAAGMKLFDAVVWISAGRPASHPLKVDAMKTKDQILSFAVIAQSVTYTFFFLLTQARYPLFSTDNEKKKGKDSAPKVPQFLTNTLGLKEGQSYYINNLTSFPPEQFDPKWIKEVRFENFGQEIMARFGLGVAGYRMFAPFKLYLPKDGLTPAQEDAYNFAKAVATHPPTWDIHPVTRNPAVLTARGNLNKNLSNLVLECFDDVQIAEMVASRVIYAKPIRDANHNNYRTWKRLDDISGDNEIFRD